MVVGSTGFTDCEPLWNGCKGEFKKFDGSYDWCVDEILLSNRELSYKSSLLRENYIVGMVNKINSVAFKITENVLDFILINNHKYGFCQDINNVNPWS